jgi:hypothetical protein
MFSDAANGKEEGSVLIVRTRIGRELGCAVDRFLLPRFAKVGYTRLNLEVNQGGSLMKVLVALLLLAMLLGPFGAWDANEVWAQSRQEPSIEGVSYSQMAQWQSLYGGGPFYLPPGHPSYGVGCVQPFPVLDEPVSCDVKKVRKGKQRRK